MPRVAIIASASGNGKTTLGRSLADALGVGFVELDALVHGPGWTETPDERLREQMLAIVGSDGWVIDGSYERKLGDLVVSSADVILWLDLSIGVWLPRLVQRSWRRLRYREELWNGNRESLRSVLWGTESLFVWAMRTHLRRRRQWPRRLGNLPVIRLRSRAEIDRLLADARAGHWPPPACLAALRRRPAPPPPECRSPQADRGPARR